MSGAHKTKLSSAELHTSKLGDGKIGRGSAHGKVILSGEHSVVYGYPALVAGIDLGGEVTVTFVQQEDEKNAYLRHILNVFYERTGVERQLVAVRLSGQLPVGAGLGSSAAVAYALLQALATLYGRELSQEEYFAMTLEAEKYVHTNPSGADPAAVVYGGWRRFQKGAEPAMTHLPLPKLSAVLINSGTPLETTGEMVQAVAAAVAAKQHLKQTLEEIGQVTVALEEALHKRKPFFELITKNQRLLEEIGAVGVQAQGMVSQLESIGAAAKVTGAGGRQKGSGMLVAFHQEPQKILGLARQNDWEQYLVELGEK